MSQIELLNDKKSRLKSELKGFKLFRPDRVHNRNLPSRSDIRRIPVHLVNRAMRPAPTVMLTGLYRLHSQASLSSLRCHC